MARLDPSTPSRRAARSPVLRAGYRLLVVGCFLAGFSLGLAGIVSATWTEPKNTRLTWVVGMLDAISTLQKSFARYRVAFIGDSTAMAYADDRTVADRLGQQLRAGPRTSIEVFDLATLGLGTHDFYFSAGKIARSNPNVFVIAVNLASFSDSFVQRFKRPVFASLLLPSRVAEAIGLPIQRIGLTADKVILYVGLTSQVDVFNNWRWLSRRQSEVVGSHQDLASLFDEALGNSATAEFQQAARRNQIRLGQAGQASQDRFGATKTKLAYDAALDGDLERQDALVMLRAAIETMTEAGVPTLAYIGPINREHMADVGVLNEEGIRHSVETIRRTVESAGAEFVDLHDLLPNEGFRDGAGHYAVEPVDGPLLVAKELAPRVARIMGLDGPPD